MTEAHGVPVVPREARAYQGHRAGLVTRFACAMIDAVVVFVLLAATYLGIAGMLFVLDPRGFTFPDAAPWFSLTLAFGYAVVYLGISWAVSGRSYGGQMLGLRVVNFRGERMRLIPAVLRAAFCVVFPFGLFWCAWSRENRSIQDTVLRTSVIYDWQPGTPPRAAHRTRRDVAG